MVCLFTLDLSTLSDNVLILSINISISDWKFSFSFWALLIWSCSIDCFSCCFSISVSAFSLSVSACKTDRWKPHFRQIILWKQKKLGSWAYLQHTQEAGLGYHVTLFFLHSIYCFLGLCNFFYPKRIMMIVLFHVNWNFIFIFAWDDQRIYLVT